MQNTSKYGGTPHLQHDSGITQWGYGFDLIRTPDSPYYSGTP